MATRFIGDSNVPLNTAFVETTGVDSRVTVSGPVLVYVCPEGVQHAVIHIVASAFVGALVAPGQSGSAPRVNADMVRQIFSSGRAFESYDVRIGPGQSFSTGSKSSVFVKALDTAYPETNALLRMSVTET